MRKDVTWGFDENDIKKNKGWPHCWQMFPPTLTEKLSENHDFLKCSVH